MQLTRFVYVFVIVNPNRLDKNIRKDIKESFVNVFNVHLNNLNITIYPIHLEHITQCTREPTGKQ